MSYPWTRISAPDDLRPVPGLFYLLLDVHITEDERRGVTDILADIGLSPAGSSGFDIEREDSRDADDAPAEPSSIVHPKSAAEQRPARPIGRASRSEGDPPVDAEARGVELQGEDLPTSIWRARDVMTAAESTALLASARARLRDAAGVLHFNPMFEPGGSAQQGRLTYGRRVLLFLHDPAQARRIQAELATFGIPADNVRALLDYVPRLSELSISFLASVWIVTLPELSKSVAVQDSVEQAIRDGDALALAEMLNRPSWTGGVLRAVPDWLQLRVPVPQPPSNPRRDPKNLPFDWWPIHVGLPQLLVDWEQAGRPAPAPVAVLDGGFDVDIQHKIEVAFAGDSGFGKLLDDIFRRSSTNPSRNRGATTHGTQVAAVIAHRRADLVRLVPQGAVLPIRIGTDVSDEKGNLTIDTSDMEFALGILSACVLGASAITISLTIVALPLTSLALSVAESVGVPVVAAAGNYVRGDAATKPDSDPYADVGFPARWLTVLSVGGFDVVDDVLAWAQWPYTRNRMQAACWRGRLDVVAPAVHVSTVRTPAGVVEAIPGTSVAAPIVAGGIALLRALHPPASPTRIRDALRATAFPRTKLLGDGAINLYKAHKMIESMPPEESNDMSGSQRSVDWMSLFVGLALGLTIAMFMFFSRGDFQGPDCCTPPTQSQPTGTPSGDPHIPVPTIHGDVRISPSKCTMIPTMPSGSVVVELSKLVGGVPSNTVTKTLSGSPYHYDFTSLELGATYRVKVQGVTTVTCGTFTVDQTITAATDYTHNLNMP